MEIVVRYRVNTGHLRESRKVFHIRVLSDNTNCFGEAYDGQSCYTPVGFTFANFKRVYSIGESLSGGSFVPDSPVHFPGFSVLRGLPSGITYSDGVWSNAVLTNAHAGVHTLGVRMRYRATSDFNSPTRTTEQAFQFTVLANEASFVNGPFTTPIEVPENIRVVGPPNLFDIHFPAGVAFENRVQVGGADANLFTARISFIITPDETATAHIELVFKKAPNFEDPQGGPDNNSNDYHVNLTVGTVGRNVTVRVTDEPESPREFVLRVVRVTPATITVDWDEPVNTGPPFSLYQLRLFRPSNGTGRFNNIDRSIRTFKYTGLTPNAEYEITVRVQTAEGGRTSNLIRVTTPPPLVPAFAAGATIPDQIYLTERPIQSLTLPEATGGNGAITYTLTGPNGETVSEALPGLSFDPATRVLSGTPLTAAVTPTTTYTYTAMDADDNTATDDTATLAFSITVEVDSVPLFTRPQPDLFFIKNEFSRRTLVEATGGNGALIYLLLRKNQLPAGLTYDGDARPPTISGTPTVFFENKQFTYAVADSDAVSDGDVKIFNIAVVDSFPEFFDPVADQRLTQNAPFNLQLSDARDGSPPRTFALTGPNGEDVSEAVPGLRFVPSLRFLLGRPTTPGTTTLTYTVTDSQGPFDTITFRITVAPAVTLDALETPGDQTYTMDTAIPALTLPTGGDGTAPLTYTLRVGPFEHDDLDATDNAVPGLLFDRATRTLTGTPTEATDGAVTLTYLARDTNDSTASFTFDITVAEAVMVESTDDQTYTMGTEIPDLTLPVATGGTGDLTYILTGPNGTDLSELPAGLLWTGGITNPGAITGTPTAAGATELTYTATDRNGSTASETFTVTVAEAVMVEATGDQFYTMGTEIPALTLPAATGGTGTLTYALTGPNGTDLSELPAGLMWTGDTTNLGTIIGTPTAITTSPVTLTYTATDENGSTDSETLTLTVAAQVAVTAPTDQFYTMGITIPDLTLQAASGGTGKLTYTLTDPDGKAVSQAVPDLTFDGESRTLSGKLTAAGTSDLTYTATDENGSTDSATFTVTVAVAVGLTDTDDQFYTMGTEIPALTLPAATDGTGTLTYTLRDGIGNDVDTTDNAVPGLTFDSESRVLSGIPTTAATTALTYTATDENGSTDSVTFTVTVAAAVALTDTDDQFYTMGTEIPALTLPLATGGTGTLTYTLRDLGGNDVDTNDNAVPGLAFDDESRVLSGTPTTATTTALTYTVTDQNGSTASDTVTLTVAAQVALNAPTDQTYTMGHPIPALTLPAATGGTGTLTYTLTGPSDAALSVVVPGLTFTATTHVLTGTPTTQPTTDLTYTVTDQNGSTDSATFSITVADGVAVNAPNDQTYTIGQTITALTLPAATGGTGTLTYTLRDAGGNDVDTTDNAVPGLSFDNTATVRTLTGTPTTAATTALTYTVTDENSSAAEVTFSITVADVVALTDTGDQTYTMGQIITALTLPAATGGTAPLTYTLRDGSGNDVPGLAFNTATRVLFGTPTTAATTPLIYTVTDDNGSTTSDTFTVTVAAAVALTDTGDQTYTMGRPITALTLPAATGGTGTLTYTLTGPSDAALSVAVPGLAFDDESRVLSGTPTTAATTALTYTVTDERGSTASDTVTLTVAAQVALNAPNNQTYTMGTEITALTLPAATGGTGTLTYTLTGPSDAALSQAVPGLAFTATTRVLSGTPTTAATTPLTYTVTDEHGSTASATLTLTVAAQVAVTAPNAQTYTMGTEITALTLPLATGGTGTLTYTLTGSSDTALSQAVPGLTFTATTRILSGTPTTVATTVLTYTVTDQNGSTASDTLTLTVAAQVAVADTGDQTYTMGTEIPALTLPAATGGTGTLTYTLRDGSGNDVDAIDNAVPGLTFDPSSRVLSGTPTTVAITALTYTVTDQNGSTDSDTVTLTVAAQVAVTAPNNQTYTMGTEIPALTLPAATGGTGTLTYTLRDGTGNDVDAVDNAVPGLTFNTTSRVLSGTPTTAATTALTYTVTDQNGSTDSATLTLTVAAQVSGDRPEQSDLYDGHRNSRPDSAGGHRRHRHADLHPDRAGKHSLKRGRTRADLHGHHPRPVRHAGHGAAHTPDLHRHRPERQHCLGHLYRDRGGAGGGDRPGRSDLYDGHRNSCPDPADGHRRHRPPDLRPDRAERYRFERTARRPDVDGRRHQPRGHHRRADHGHHQPRHPDLYRHRPERQHRFGDLYRDRGGRSGTG